MIGRPIQYNSTVAGVARNFDWEEPKMEKSSDVISLTFFGDVIMMTH